MAAFKTVQYTNQSAASANGAAMADGNLTGETLLIARCRYTVVGTEAANDTIGILLLGPGSTVIPALSSYFGTAPGTTLTGLVGTSTDTDAYSSALNLSAGGLVRFVPTTYPTELLVPTLVQFTISSAATLTVGAVLEFDIAYATRH